MSKSETNPCAKTVLLVDNDASFLRVLGRAMTKRGYAVRAASTIGEVQEAVSQIAPDFAVVDLHLGGESGLDVLAYLRDHSPDTVSVLLSGYATPATAVSAVKLGATDCLAKPVELEQLEYALMQGRDTAAEVPERVMTPSEARLAHVLAHWEQNDRNTMATAKILGMHRRTLQRILRRAGIGRDVDEPPITASNFGKLRRMYQFWSRQLSA